MVWDPSARSRVFRLPRGLIRSLVATHINTGIKVAIKILNKDKIRQLDMSEKVKREIKIMKEFNHPHITRLYFCHVIVGAHCPM